MNVRCPVCGSPRLSPKTIARFSKGEVQAWYVLNPGAGFFSKEMVIASAQQARICGDCGYVLLFVSEETRDELNRKWDHLHPEKG